MICLPPPGWSLMGGIIQMTGAGRGDSRHLIQIRSVAQADLMTGFAYESPSFSVYKCAIIHVIGHASSYGTRLTQCFFMIV